MGLFSTLTTRHYRLAAVLWTLGIIGACLVPTNTLSTVQPAIGFDKVIHVLLFAAFGGLWMRVLCPPILEEQVCQRRGVIFFLIGACFAVGTEILQHVVPIQRLADPYDILADLIGLGTAIVAYGYNTHRKAYTSNE